MDNRDSNSKLESVIEKLETMDAAAKSERKEQNRTNIATVGFSVGLVGVGFWVQQGAWTSVGNFTLFVGFLLMVLALTMHKPGFQKWIRRAFFAALVVFFGLIIATIAVFIWA